MARPPGPLDGKCLILFPCFLLRNLRNQQYMMCVQIDGVTISAKSEVQLNGQGFIQVGNCKTSPNVNLPFLYTLGQNHF